uniref:USP domain-containing protein n=1 Tax=Zonotrichia albicollis TaxID=44394 RepID=A0A8D2M6B5_ZONAL
MKRGGFDITKGKEISLGDWKDLGNPDTGHSYPSVEELKNIWIPHAIKMRLTKSKELDVSNWSETDELSPTDDPESVYIYDLMATVVHILDSRTGGSLVGHIKVGETYHQRKEGVTHQQWYLFNDFLIEPVDKCEAVQFDMSWKVPAILYYARRNLNSKYNLVIKNPIEASVLLAEASLARKQRKCHATFIPLMLNEMPQAGDLVGLDAEFVTLNEEEAELRSDGTKSTIKPSQMSVARITCVRGQGPNEGVPFIDDYISTQEQVVDYLTQYSGIKPGDLDAKISSKHLTTLKSTYLKLRFLIDVGVKFVGHGLQKDFRVINLMVTTWPWWGAGVGLGGVPDLQQDPMSQIPFLAWLAALGYFLFSVNSSLRGKNSTGRNNPAGAALLSWKCPQDCSQAGEEAKAVADVPNPAWMSQILLGCPKSHSDVPNPTQMSQIPLWALIPTCPSPPQVQTRNIRVGAPSSIPAWL